jgi:ribosomal protein S18 acetylase RimI-like enzyme
VRVQLQLAAAADVADLLSLHAAVNERLIAQYGKGFWISALTEKGALFAMRNSSVYIARYRNRTIATLTFSTKKPWAIDKQYFSHSKRPLYLTAMAVHPDDQRRGTGTLCMEEARRIAVDRQCDAIRLDAYDAEAGAGEFYRKCGFCEVGRAAYRGAPLIYYEMLL